MHSSSPIKSVRIAVHLVETMAKTRQAGPAQLAAELDMPKSTVHDYLRTLHEEGYATKTDGKYELSYRFLELGSRVRNLKSVYPVARFEIEKLSTETGEHASLIMEEEGYGVVLFNAVGESLKQVVDWPGTRASLHATAPGKAIMANMSEERFDAVIDRRGLPKETENTVDSRSDLESELETVRERGYATDDGEIIEGMGGIATTIGDQNPTAQRTAISLYGPAQRTDFESLSNLLLQTANIIDVNMSYN